LTLPLVAGQAILAFRNEKDQLGRAFWGFLLLVSITSVFVNTSRASMAIGILIMAVLAVGVAIVAVRRRGKISLRPQVLAIVAVVLVCAAVLTLSLGVERSLARWNETLNSLFASEGALWEGRVSMYRRCWLSLHSAGWFGFGPGTFSIMFPFLELKQGRELDHIVRYAHQDYLQTALEWGAIGFTLWAILIGGGVARAFRRFLSNPQSMTREHGMWIALSTLSLIGVLIHSLVDFPLQIASLQLITAVLLGQLWACFSRKDRRSQEQMTFSNRSPSPQKEPTEITSSHIRT
jgi:O-antigen ligase